MTPRAISERFGVSWQQANARVRRLERLKLLGCERQHLTQPQAVFLTGRGHELLGWERRRSPRADVQREHEAAIVWLITDLERHAGPGVEVLTERECRKREAAEPARRYSVDVAHGGPRNDRRRWPDAVVESTDDRRAFEIEFAPKGTDRLKRIVDAYQVGSPYCDVVFFVKNARLGQRIQRLARQRRPSRFFNIDLAHVHVEAWPALPVESHAELVRQLSG